MNGFEASRHLHPEVRPTSAAASAFTLLSAGCSVLLFVREENRRGGVTLPFLCLGLTDDVSHEGERPMAIRWRLHRAIPGDFYPELAVAV